MHKEIFGSNPILTRNESGGIAHKLSTLETLAQLVMTGTFNHTYYANAQDHLKSLQECLKECEKSLNPSTLGLTREEIAVACDKEIFVKTFISKLAIYSRENGFMKDMPTFIVAWMSKNVPELFPQTFRRVIDNGKMLRNFVEVIRSGVVGRKSFGTVAKRLIQEWLTQSSDNKLIRNLVGKPSLADIIKMTHPCPANPAQSAFFNWILTGNKKDYDILPMEIRQLIDFRDNIHSPIPKVPFELLTQSELSSENWKEIIKNAGYHMIRMNLNTFGRKGIYADQDIIRYISERLANEDSITNARVMPYQLFTSWKYLADDVPSEIGEALEKAIKISLRKVPILGKRVCVCADVSGSMSSPITGFRKGSTSRIKCIDVASLIATSILYTNPRSEVILFDTKPYFLKNETEFDIFSLANKMSSIGGGGTNCAVPLEYLNKNSIYDFDVIFFISDNESWINARWNWPSTRFAGKKTNLEIEWDEYKIHNPEAKMICLDIQPYTTSQIKSSDDIINIGGFNDSVFDAVKSFLDESENWVDLICRKVNL